MENSNTEQAEEIEALISIYDGDTLFKQISGTSFSYKVKILKSFSNLF
jgi:hypothetical protein